MQKSSTQSLASIVNNNQRFKPSIDHSLSTIDGSKVIDNMLEDCADLIDPNYKPWFAKRFMRMPAHRVAVAASSARQTLLYKPSTNTQKLFTSLIRKEAGF